MSQIPRNYVFSNPFATSIYPILNTEKTLSLLHEINASQRAEKRLPMEILLHINKEIHANDNALLKKIRSRWTPVDWKVGFGILDFGYFDCRKSPIRLKLNRQEKKYYLQEKPNSNGIYESYGIGYRYDDDTSIEELYLHISSADLLYRTRCCFPEVAVDSDSDRYKTAWDVYIKHNQSGLLLQFEDYRGGSTTRAFYGKDSAYHHADRTIKETLSDTFNADVLLLLSILYETIDGSRRLRYYHPAADADLFNDIEQKYISVSYECSGHRVNDEDIDESVYDAWKVTDVSDADISSFPSILQDLKYDVSSRKIDGSDGTTDLTTVISSALLFYRLICKFMLGCFHNNINTQPPITSVWQIQLTHVSTGQSIIFMDDRGLFDIRAGAGIKEVMGDIDALVEALCSDACTHSYDGIVAGCVA